MHVKEALSHKNQLPADFTGSTMVRQKRNLSSFSNRRFSRGTSTNVVINMIALWLDRIPPRRFLRFILNNFLSKEIFHLITRFHLLVEIYEIPFIIISEHVIVTDRYIHRG